MTRNDRPHGARWTLRTLVRRLAPLPKPRCPEGRGPPRELPRRSVCRPGSRLACIPVGSRSTPQRGSCPVLHIEVASGHRHRVAKPGLVLLCYKRRRPQKGQQGSCRSSAPARARRMVAMEWGLCRPHGSGTAAWLEPRRKFRRGYFQSAGSCRGGKRLLSATRKP